MKKRETNRWDKQQNDKFKSNHIINHIKLKDLNSLIKSQRLSDELKKRDPLLAAYGKSILNI